MLVQSASHKGNSVCVLMWEADKPRDQYQIEAHKGETTRILYYLTPSLSSEMTVSVDSFAHTNDSYTASHFPFLQ